MPQLQARRFPHATIGLATGLFVAGCTPVAYSGPEPVSTTVFSRELNASYDQVWSAVTYVAGATFFNIHNFDKGSGLMTLEYSNLRGGPGLYVACGTVAGGFSPVVITPEKDSVLNSILGIRTLTLSGQANITVRSSGPRRTTVQINSLYTLTALGQSDAGPRVIAEWRFTSREGDTQTVAVGLQPTAVTCRPSYKIENEFLTEVAARI